MRLDIMKRTIRVGLALSLALALAACKQSVNLEGVRAAASAATAAQDSFNAIAEDFYDSCVRRNVYASISSQMSLYFPTVGKTPPSRAVLVPGAAAGEAGRLTPESILNLPAGRLAQELTPPAAAHLSETQLMLIISRPDESEVFLKMSPDALAALKSAPIWQSQTSDETACDESRVAANSWQSGNSIVVSYFVALGKLAGGSRSDDSFGVKALAGDVGTSKLIGSTQAKALGTFANTALSDIYDAKRRDALAEFIPKANGALDGAIDALESIATDQYSFVLKREQKAEQEFLRRNLGLAKPGADAFAVLSYADAWATREADLQKRFGAIQSYKAALQKLRAWHTALLKSIDANDSGAAANVLESLATSLKPDLDAMQTVFKKGKG